MKFMTLSFLKVKSQRLYTVLVPVLYRHIVLSRLYSIQYIANHIVYIISRYLGIVLVYQYYMGNRYTVSVTTVVIIQHSTGVYCNTILGSRISIKYRNLAPSY